MVNHAIGVVVAVLAAAAVVVAILIGVVVVLVIGVVVVVVTAVVVLVLVAVVVVSPCHLSPPPCKQDGHLGYHDFFILLQHLKLGLSLTEIFAFYNLCDGKNDGVIMWEDRERELPLLLKRVYDATPPGPHDWCPVVTTSHTTIYYNKRTGREGHKVAAAVVVVVVIVVRGGRGGGGGLLA